MKTRFLKGDSRQNRRSVGDDRASRSNRHRGSPRSSGRRARSSASTASAGETAHRSRIWKNRGFDLKQDYTTTLMMSLVAALALTIALFRADLYSTSRSSAINLTEQEVVQMEEIQQTRQLEKPPPPPRPPVPVEVPDDTILDDDVLDLDVTLDLDEAVRDVPPPPPPPAEETPLPEPEIFVVVEEMPEIIGGPQKVYEYLEYPPIARQAGMEGLVVVQIVVDETGSPQSPNAVRSAGAVLDEAAIKAVMQLKFRPGRQRGRAVKVRLAIPIRFRFRDIRSGG